jgi:hypothetical protein
VRKKKSISYPGYKSTLEHFNELATFDRLRASLWGEKKEMRIAAFLPEARRESRGRD